MTAGIPQHILYEGGGTVSVEPPERASSATVTVTTGAGDTIVEDAAATVSPIDSALASAAPSGSETLTLGSDHGVAEGDGFWLWSPDEHVRARSVDGNTVTLWSPTLYAHAISSAVEGTKLSYVVSAALAASLWWDGWARFELSSGEVYEVACCCTKHPVRRTATVDDLRLLVPAIQELLDSGDDIDALIDAAHADVLLGVEESDRVHLFVGSQAFARAVAYRVLEQKYEHDASDAGTVLWERYTAQREKAVAQAVATMPRDANQDGIIEGNERMSMRSRRVVRA